MIDRDRDPQEFGRLLSLSDAIFGVAMTLLVVSVVIPAGLSSREFSQALVDLLPRIGIMALSIAVAASAWLTHHRLFALVQRVDNGLLHRNIIFLGLVVFIPLPHQVLGSYASEPLAYVLYAVVLGLINAMAIVMDVHVRRRGLLRVAQTDAEFRTEIYRGLLYVGGFGLSIPLAFMLVGWTPIVWILLLPLDRLIVIRAARLPAEPEADDRDSR